MFLKLDNKKVSTKCGEKLRKKATKM